MFISLRLVRECVLMGLVVRKSVHARIQRVWADRGSGPPGKSQNIGFLSSTGPDPLNITILPSQHSMLGHHRHASETPFKWRFAGVPMVLRL